jgi:hypothetical protein
MNYLIMLKEHLKLFWHLRNITELQGAKFVWSYLILFPQDGSYKIPEKIKLVGFVSEDQLCHEHKMSAATHLFFV